MEFKDSIQSFSVDEIKDILAGMPAYRAEQIFRMAAAHKSYEESTNLPASLKEFLAASYVSQAVTLVQKLVGKDGVNKYLLQLADGNIIESVYMPHSYGDTLCVSTQVGCRMGCAFCASGIGGLKRSLTAGEIAGQVYFANRDHGGTPTARALTNLVLMGSGEPLDNYDAVLRFLALISDPRGLGISPRNISISTVGLPNEIRRLADSGFPVTLSVSLHAPTDEMRAPLIPMNKKHNIKEIMQAVHYFSQKTGRRVIFEYALATGETVSQKAAAELIRLTRGLRCHVNLIPLNRVPEKNIIPASKEETKSFLKTLEDANVSATIRRSMGNDIGGACGQLRNKFVGDLKGKK